MGLLFNHPIHGITILKDSLFPVRVIDKEYYEDDCSHPPRQGGTAALSGSFTLRPRHCRQGHRTSKGQLFYSNP